MSEAEVWRPLGVDSDDEIAEYDALHDGVPTWMSTAFWAWMRDTLTERRYKNTTRQYLDHLREAEVEEMCQALRIPLPNLRFKGVDRATGQNQLDGAIRVLREHQNWLQIADYSLAHFENAKAGELDALLERSKSAWRVGTRSGRPGLVRRVPEGVQVGGDLVMARAGNAGIRLAKAWEELYGQNPNPSEAYRLAILAVEDAAIPVVSASDSTATLGKVIGQISSGTWRLPMAREHDDAKSHDVLVGMMRVLWHGQHDRHGGQPSGPGNVSMEEATVAVGLATTLVQYFDAGLVARQTSA
jgi:hypothetical protein